MLHQSLYLARSYEVGGALRARHLRRFTHPGYTGYTAARRNGPGGGGQAESCPECGTGPLVHTEGCLLCLCCGWSACGG